ncbi:MAG TPA: hypothetical protein VFP32_01690 [Candidatus Saccharimonadales bacterium]|nr:hypothetical protein [Candidatus Saccharimonadales bacterium]
MEQLKLPSVVVGQTEVARLERELNELDDFFVDAKGRQTGTSFKPPKLSRLLDELSQENDVNLLNESERSKLIKDINELLSRAPRLHISFASEPSPKALERVLTWLRDNIHPQILLQVGLQPTIAAGCVLRTPNKVFDMSLRASLQKEVPYLTKLIAGAVDGK